MIDFDAACATIRALPERTARERVALAQAAGRVLAQDVVAGLDMPRHAVSAMDGYAVREADLARLPARLPVVGPVFAGQDALPALPPGSCLRVFTGARVPDDAQRVVVQEQVRVEAGHALFETPLSPARNIRARASDFAAGERLLAAGTRLDARGIVAVAGADLAEVEVFARPRVAVLATGDELCAPGQAHASPGAIPESVSFGAAAMAEQWGGCCVHRQRLPDALDRLEAAAAAALEQADLLVVTGGASVGEKDYAKRMLQPLGLELLFARLAIKPGKPVWLGRARGRLVLGLPGNPSSAMVTARLLLAPLLARLGGGDPDTAWHWRLAELAAPLEPGGAMETFARAGWSQGRVLPSRDRGSASQAALVQAQLLLRIRREAPAQAAGSGVRVLEF